MLRNYNKLVRDFRGRASTTFNTIQLFKAFFAKSMKLVKIKASEEEIVLYEVYKRFVLHRLQYDDDTTQNWIPRK